MSTTADIVAITEMVRAKFVANPLDRIVGQPSISSVRLLVKQLAKIVPSFKTTQWGGKHGHLKLALGIKKYKLVIIDPDLSEVDFGKIQEPSLASDKFKENDDANAVEKKKAAHKVLWREYESQEAINAVGVEMIVEAVDEQYVAQLEADYIGYTGVTIFGMLEHLRTWYKVTNAQQLAIKERFLAPWSETPDAHVSTYARQLDKRQIECSELKVPVSDADKLLHFIGQMFSSDLFERKFLDDWEDADAVDWKATVEHFSNEFGKIGRARERAAERAGEEYSSAAALTQPARRKGASTQPSNAAVSAISEYAAALELRVDELQTLVDDQSVLTTGTEDGAFGFTDDVDVASDGLIYFTDASSKFGQGEYALDLLEFRPHGSLLVYDPATGQTRRLLDNLYFANGVALSSDESFLLVNETWKYRILRYWLKGERAGQHEVFIDNLPGFPDGVSGNGSGTFWVALPSPRKQDVDDMHASPWLKNIVAKLPKWMLPKAIEYGLVLALDEQGNIIASYHDPDGKHLREITSVEEHQGSIYLGSLGNDRIGQLELKPR